MVNDPVFEVKYTVSKSSKETVGLFDTKYKNP